ncbi:MAG: hypothetical protein ABIP06_00480 [Pyrinomonadaceae bacterium]
MNLKRTRLNILPEKADLSCKAQTGVSLHCHTEHSKEMMDFIPVYTERIPVISALWLREKKKYEEREQKKVDFSNSFWSPPLPAMDVYLTEKQQMNDSGLNEIISITDHDCIDGNLKVNEKINNTKAPISLEWTVPFEYGFFHIGVHNLPKKSAVEISKNLIDFSFSEIPAKERLSELFVMLNDLPDVLVILNHPIWDIEMVGKEKHRILLNNFLKEFGKWIHALEVNGFRKWSENKAVIEIAESLEMPVVTGGDRHGCKPNTVINLTNSDTFAGFAEEIRVDKRSEIVFMPDYRQPLLSRQLHSFSEILSTYTHLSEDRQNWQNRVYYDNQDGKGLAPLSVHWAESGYRLWLRASIQLLGFLGSPVMRPVFHLFRNKKDRVPKNIANENSESFQIEDVSTTTFTSDNAL